MIGIFVILFSITEGHAAVDYFLKLDGIDGESTSVGFEAQIQIASFSWGVSRPRGASAPSISEIVVTKSTDVTSPKLFLSCASGQHIKEAKLTCRKAGSDRGFYIITLTDVLITSYQSAGSSGDVVPTDQFSLNYTKITFEYQPQDATGKPTGPSVVTSWPSTTGGAPQ
jgi:type VI secretion system secreted protein Hcp